MRGAALSGALGVLLICGGLIAGCESSDDGAGFGDASGSRSDGFVFTPNDAQRHDSGVGTKDVGGGGDDTGTVTDSGGGAPDTAADTPAPADVPPVDVPSSDVPSTDVPSTDVGPVCQENGVGCPCASDEFCLAHDDGDLCNGYLVCRDRVCVEDPSTVVECPAADGICKDWRCQASTGQCVEVILGDEGDACDNGNPCTGGDTCQGGVCTAGPIDLCGGGGCQKAGDLQCGGAWGWSTVSQQATELIEQYGCVAGTFPGRELSFQMNVTGGTQVVFKLSAGLHRLFLIPGGPDCEVAQCLDSTTNELHWKDADGGQYWVVIDGSTNGTIGLEIDCYPRAQEEHLATCKNGIDDDWDGTTDCDDTECVEDPWCIPRVCGDGICHPTGEDVEDCPEDCAECGDGLCTDGFEDCDTCEPDCGACPFCGDGECNGTETCDTCRNDCGDCPVCGDGDCEGTEGCATCPDDCGECPTPCVDAEIACGGTASGFGMSSEQNSVSGYTCGCGTGTRGDRMFRFVSPTTRNVSVRLTTDNGFCDRAYDLYVLEAACDGAACIDCEGGAFTCNKTIDFTAQAGVPYVLAIEVDDFDTEPDWDLDVTCD